MQAVASPLWPWVFVRHGYLGQAKGLSGVSFSRPYLSPVSVELGRYIYGSGIFNSPKSSNDGRSTSDEKGSMAGES